MMDLAYLWRVLLRRWWLIAIPVLIAGGWNAVQLMQNGLSNGGYAVSFKYSAAQSASNLPNRDGDYQDVWLASEYAVLAFTEWVRSGSFRAEIQSIVGADVDLAPLGIAADKARSIGVVQMSYPDATTLERIAAAAIEVLQTRNQAYFPHLGAAPATVTLIDPPVIVPNPPPLGNRFAPLLQVGVALLGGLLLAALMELLDGRIFGRPELAQMGIPILASIPKEK